MHASGHGCSRSVAHISCCKAWKKSIVNMVTVSGETWQCEVTSTIRIQVSNGACADTDVIVTAVKSLGFFPPSWNRRNKGTWRCHNQRSGKSVLRFNNDDAL